MKSLIAVSLILALSVPAAAQPLKMTDTQLDKVVAGAMHTVTTTTNPGGNPGGCSNNPNCTTTTVTLNPQDKPPPGQNK